MRPWDDAYGETALKLLCFNRAALAYSGSVDLALKIAEVFDQCVHHVADPREAFKRAIDSCGPYGSKECVQVLMAAAYDGGVVLQVFDLRGDFSITDIQEGELVQLGTIPDLFCTETIYWLRAVMASPNIPARLVGLLGALQGYGVRNQLIPEGVGGAFAGMVVLPQGIAWAEDTLYILAPFGESLAAVSSIVRGNTHIVRSTLNQRVVAFSHPMTAGPAELWEKIWGAQVAAFPMSGAYNFVVVIDLTKRTVAVCLMAGAMKTTAVEITRDPVDPKALSVEFSGRVMRFLRTEQGRRGEAAPLSLGYFTRNSASDPEVSLMEDPPRFIDDGDGLFSLHF